MGTQLKFEYLQTIQPKYRTASKSDKKKILNEFCTTCEYNHKYVIRFHYLFDDCKFAELFFTCFI